MPVVSDVYSLVANRPDNGETADAVEIETILQDLEDGINYGINAAVNITVGYSDLTGLPTTLAGYGITDAQALDATLTALAGVTFAADKALYSTGADAFATFDFSSYMRGIMGSADEAALKTAINFTDNTPQLDAVNTYTAAQRTTIVTLADGATITPDMDDGNDFQVTLGGNRTLANPTNLTEGQSGSIRVIQDGTGSRTLAFGSYFKFSGGTPPTFSTGAGSVDILHYKVWSTTFIEVSAHLDVS
jgi:hypothetical protein